jgi:hypothetical protein
VDSTPGRPLDRPHAPCSLGHKTVKLLRLTSLIGFSSAANIVSLVCGTTGSRTPLRESRRCVHLQLSGRAQLISWCLAKPLTVSGWDVVDQCAKPTRLAVSAGSVYYFLCENGTTGRMLAERLHWRPRSDFYGEKGCGYGLCSFAVNTHRTSVDVRSLAEELFRE